MDFSDDYGFEPEPEERERDPKVDEAKEVILESFMQNPDDVFYERQIQVKFEKNFFHWITADALHELRDEAKIRSEVLTLEGAVKIRFYWSPSNRYWKRKASQIQTLVKQYSKSSFTTAIGAHGETMFDAALPRVGFLPIARNVSEYKGTKWTKTDHNLDRIFIRDNIPYGTEIKNTLDYIPHDELTTKIEMCQFLGLRALFIMRYAPKNYIYEVIQAGGFCLIFQDQLYPYGFDELARRVKTELGLPVHCPKFLEDGLVKRLLTWHTKKLPADGR